MTANSSEDSVWCRPCKSFHPDPRDVAHWKALKCFADPPKAAKPKATEICGRCGLPHADSGEITTFDAYWEEKEPYGSTPEDVAKLAFEAGVKTRADCFYSKSKAMSDLLGLVGEAAKCRGCQAEIFWVTHRNGKKTPYTPAGLNHFIDCPAAKQFGKGKDA